MSTPKQIAANRQNAQRSTGPKTANGKAVVRRNAFKHGILARHVVLKNQYKDESEREFQQLHRHYWQYLAPVGPVEEMLVERIVTTHWRLQRVLIAERGEIDQRVDGKHWYYRQLDRFAKELRIACMSPMPDGDLRLEQSFDGLIHLEMVLENVRASVEQTGELTDAALEQTHLGGKKTLLTVRLENLRAAPLEVAAGSNGEAVKPERREMLLKEIDRTLDDYRLKQDICLDHEIAEEEATLDAAHLPDAGTLDKIMRYETTLERQLYRAINQLERLQRMRHGEAVPSPVLMEVGHAA